MKPSVRIRCSCCCCMETCVKGETTFAVLISRFRNYDTNLSSFALTIETTWHQADLSRGLFVPSRLFPATLLSLRVLQHCSQCMASDLSIATKLHLLLHRKVFSTTYKEDPYRTSFPLTWVVSKKDKIVTEMSSSEGQPVFDYGHAVDVLPRL